MEYTIPLHLTICYIITGILCNDGHSNSTREVQDVQVTTSYGQLLIGLRTTDEQLSTSHGVSLDVVTSTVDIFKGIPFAKPPVGPLRFAAPVDITTTGHPMRTDHYGHSCPQLYGSPKSPTTADNLQDEDCLYINLFSPYEVNHTDAVYPVLVFIHGGSYEAGAGSEYDLETLAQTGIVCVTFNYRLGALGYLSSGVKPLTGNYGLLDQEAALRWTRENILKFRGQRDGVTVAGHSVGGASVGILMNMPRANNLFHRAVMMSGFTSSVYSMSPSSDKRSYIDQVAGIMGCDATLTLPEIVECLRSVPWQRFKKKRQLFPGINTQGGIIPEFRPIVDHVVLDKDYSRYVDKHRVLPVMLGTVHGEFTGMISDVNLAADIGQLVDVLVEKKDQLTKRYLLDAYTDYATGNIDYNRVLNSILMYTPCGAMASSMSKRLKGQVYQYHFNVSNSYHSMELNYFFGAPFSGRHSDDIKAKKFTKEDAIYSKKIMDIFTKFIKSQNMEFLDWTYNNGTNTTVSEWKLFDDKDKYYLHMNNGEMKMKHRFKSHEVKLIYDFIPAMTSRFRLFSHPSDILTSVSCPDVTAVVILVSLVLCLILIQTVFCLFGWRICPMAEHNGAMYPVSSARRKGRGRVGSSWFPWNRGLTFSSEEAGLSNGAVELDAK